MQPFNIALGGINIVLFFFWLALIRYEGVTSGTDSFTISYLSLLITILGLILVFVTIVISVLAIVGFRNIKKKAIKDATKAANKEVNRIVNDLHQSGALIPKVNTVPPTGASTTPQNPKETGRKDSDTT